MLFFSFFCTFVTDIINATFRHPSSQQQVPVWSVSRGSVWAAADGSVPVWIQPDFKRSSHHLPPPPCYFFLSFLFFGLSARLWVWWSIRLCPEKNKQKKIVAAATFEKISCEILARFSIVSLIRTPSFCPPSLPPTPPARPQRNGDVPEKKSPGFKKKKGGAMRLGGSVRFASAHDTQLKTTFPSVRYKQIHKTTTWPAFTSTDNHKDHCAPVWFGCGRAGDDRTGSSRLLAPEAWEGCDPQSRR